MIVSSTRRAAASRLGPAAVAFALAAASPLHAQQPLARIDTALAAERWADARAQLDTALAASPRDPQLLQRRGRARRELDDLDGALADYTAAVAAEPGLGTAWAGRAATQVRRDAPDSALADLARARATGLRDPQLDMIEGLARLGKNDLAGAHEAFGRVVRSTPTVPQAWYFRGLASGRAGRHAEAAQDFTHAIERGMPGHAAFSARAQARYRQQDLAGACADAREAVSRGDADLAARLPELCP